MSNDASLADEMIRSEKEASNGICISTDRLELFERGLWCIDPDYRVVQLHDKKRTVSVF